MVVVLLVSLFFDFLKILPSAALCYEYVVVMVLGDLESGQLDTNFSLISLHKRGLEADY